MVMVGVKERGVVMGLLISVSSQPVLERRRNWCEEKMVAAFSD